MATKRMCGDCGIRPINRNNAADNDLCGPCNDYAEWENTHSDWAHEFATDGEDGIFLDNCPVCHPELDPRTAAVRTGHTNTVAKSHRSHAGCNHPRTPRDRAICRKAGGPKA